VNTRWALHPVSCVLCPGVLCPVASDWSGAWRPARHGQ